MLEGGSSLWVTLHPSGFICDTIKSKRHLLVAVKNQVHQLPPHGAAEHSREQLFTISRITILVCVVGEQRGRKHTPTLVHGGTRTPGREQFSKEGVLQKELGVSGGVQAMWLMKGEAWLVASLWWHMNTWQTY